MPSDSLTSPSPVLAAGQQPEAVASLQSCDLCCHYARSLADPAYAQDWVWCARPGCANRLVHIGRDCPRYQAAAHRFDHAP